SLLSASFVTRPTPTAIYPLSLHDALPIYTEAKEVDEPAFFSLGDSGGTKMSEAYKLAMRIIDKRYNPREWNIYPFLFSDGYNWGDAECVELVKKMVDICNLVGYGEIANDIWS